MIGTPLGIAMLDSPPLFTNGSDTSGGVVFLDEKKKFLGLPDARGVPGPPAPGRGPAGAGRRGRLESHGRGYELRWAAGRGTGLGKPIKMINTPRRENIPIYVASLGEKSVEMCAEVADGWLPYLFIPERADSVWGAALRK